MLLRIIIIIIIIIVKHIHPVYRLNGTGIKTAPKQNHGQKAKKGDWKGSSSDIKVGSPRIYDGNTILKIYMPWDFDGMKQTFR